MIFLSITQSNVNKLLKTVILTNLNYNVIVSVYILMLWYCIGKISNCIGVKVEVYNSLS